MLCTLVYSKGTEEQVHVKVQDAQLALTCKPKKKEVCLPFFMSSTQFKLNLKHVVKCRIGPSDKEMKGMAPKKRCHLKKFNQTVHLQVVDGKKNETYQLEFSCKQDCIDFLLAVKNARPRLLPFDSSIQIG